MSVSACPECDATDIYHRQGNGFDGRHAGGEQGWRCKSCGARFEEPHERASHADCGEHRKGLAGDLADADPSEVTR